MQRAWGVCRVCAGPAWRYTHFRWCSNGLRKLDVGLAGVFEDADLGPTAPALLRMALNLPYEGLQPALPQAASRCGKFHMET